MSNFWIGIWVETLDRGGLESVVALLAERLSAGGQLVRVLCSLTGGHTANLLQQRGIPVRIFHGDGDQCRNYLLADPPSLLNTHNTRRLLECAAGLPIPIIETVHGTGALYTPAMWQQERERSQHFRHLIAVSQRVKKGYIRGHGDWPAERITVIPNAVDPARCSTPPPDVARKHLSIAAGEFVVLQLASFDAHKNQLGLMTAFEQFQEGKDDATLLLAGAPVNTVYYQNVFRYRARLPSRSKIRLLGLVDDVADLFAAADICVVPSYTEGWSVAASEALAAGVPLIHTDCGSGSELCAEGRGILISHPAGANGETDRDRMVNLMYRPCPPNTPELVATLEQVYLRRSEWRVRHADIRSSARALLAVDRMVNGYLSLFQSCTV